MDILEVGRALVSDLVSHGNLIITLAPLPRLEQPCCSNPKHGFVDTSSVQDGCSRLNTHIRNLRLFMSKSCDFVMSNGYEKAVVFTPVYVFKTETVDRPKLTGLDGVHSAPDDTRHLATFLLVLTLHLQSGLESQFLAASCWSTLPSLDGRSTCAPSTFHLFPESFCSTF